MSEAIGRTGFHVKHVKHGGQGTSAERGKILGEMMRELDPKLSAYWAAQNSNIVAADEPLNEAYVNDGGGSFHRCTNTKEVISYGDAREKKVTRKIGANSVTLSLLVAHLPKSMCVEVPDFYPVLDDGGKQKFNDAGAPVMRSRWVARDRDEARKYFMDALGYLANEVLPGGMDAVHGIDVQHSESTPHIQILADTFGPSPKDPDALRVDASRAWFSHRDVRYPESHEKADKMISGNEKMRGYHEQLKEHMLALGYPVEAEVDLENYMNTSAKEQYAQAQDARRIAAADLEDVEQARIDVAAAQRIVDANGEEMRALYELRLSEQQELTNLKAEFERELPELRRRAKQVARDEGYEVGKTAAEAEVAAQRAALAQRERAASELHSLARDAHIAAQQRQADLDAARDAYDAALKTLVGVKLPKAVVEQITSERKVARSLDNAQKPGKVTQTPEQKARMAALDSTINENSPNTDYQR